MHWVDVRRGDPALHIARPDRARRDVMNEHVFHMEIVILTTYISVLGLLWKSNWRNYIGDDICQKVRGVSPNTNSPF